MAQQHRNPGELRAKVRLPAGDQAAEVVAVMPIPEDMRGLKDETLWDCSSLKKVMPPRPEGDEPVVAFPPGTPDGWVARVVWKPAPEKWINDPEWDGFGLWKLIGFHPDRPGGTFTVDAANRTVAAAYAVSAEG